ncbi:hypothetical protein PAPYR_6063 [Paratrimastix pyriformis]|uniref:TLDc domain-containing protein n=1 Tax=Paratrimastix pyriformis TaxID=342808 RepID=A0ABQ8UG44_9EUKA|nr:hypothetical protein PAPYR_6063 [Paratrimastix pyriformis]
MVLAATRAHLEEEIGMFVEEARSLIKLLPAIVHEPIGEGVPDPDSLDYRRFPYAIVNLLGSLEILLDRAKFVRCALLHDYLELLGPALNEALWVIDHVFFFPTAQLLRAFFQVALACDCHSWREGFERLCGLMTPQQGAQLRELWGKHDDSQTEPTQLLPTFCLPDGVIPAFRDKCGDLFRRFLKFEDRLEAAVPLWMSANQQTLALLRDLASPALRDALACRQSHPHAREHCYLATCRRHLDTRGPSLFPVTLLLTNPGATATILAVSGSLTDLEVSRNAGWSGDPFISDCPQGEPHLLDEWEGFTRLHADDACRAAGWRRERLGVLETLPEDARVLDLGTSANLSRHLGTAAIRHPGMTFVALDPAFAPRYTIRLRPLGAPSATTSATPTSRDPIDAAPTPRDAAPTPIDAAPTPRPTHPVTARQVAPSPHDPVPAALTIEVRLTPCVSWCDAATGQWHSTCQPAGGTSPDDGTVRRALEAILGAPQLGNSDTPGVWVASRDGHPWCEARLVDPPGEISPQRNTYLQRAGRVHFGKVHAQPAFPWVPQGPIRTPPVDVAPSFSTAGARFPTNLFFFGGSLADFTASTAPRLLPGGSRPFDLITAYCFPGDDHMPDFFRDPVDRTLPTAFFRGLLKLSANGGRYVVDDGDWLSMYRLHIGDDRNGRLDLESKQSHDGCEAADEVPSDPWSLHFHQSSDGSILIE